MLVSCPTLSLGKLRGNQPPRRHRARQLCLPHSGMLVTSIRRQKRRMLSNSLGHQAIAIGYGPRGFVSELRLSLSAMSVESVDVRHFTVPNPGFEDSEDVVKEEDTSDSSISVSTPSLRRPKPSYVSQEWAAYSARLHYERDRSRNRWVHPEWEERSLLRQKLLLKTRRLKGGKVNSTSVLDEFTDPPFPDQAKSRRMFPALFARHAFTEEEASEYALAIGKARLVTYHSRWGEYDIKFVSQLIDIAIYNKVIPSEQRVQHLAKKFGESSMGSSTTTST
ncbi:Transcription factor iws1 [Perkinsus olseni]|uniref:Transcription factor iws1 n=1 Tax=Perkinsus olseni TaxID=32597 RepID=A0A7J6UID8_PEROL|nr:Transcription factor iws1 [Perkinsus olseni]